LKKFVSIALLPICLATPVMSYGAGPEQVVPLTKPDDIRYASSMDQAIVRLGDKVTECVRGKLAPDNECFCLYPQELSHVRKTYEDTIKRHPEWKNKIVSYTREGRTFAVSFGGLRRQLDTQCSQGR
jgi:hypothetical protein